MQKKHLEEALKAIVSTNFGLQNSLGNYAKVSSDAVALLTAKPTTEARLERIENRLDQIGTILNGFRVVPGKKKKRRRK